MALDLDTIGGKDWYGWGSEVLLANQGADGSWHGEYPAAVDTCFALLFLKRANLTRDLTSGLKGKMQDPGAITLKSGGVGGDALKGGLKSGLESKDARPSPDEPPTAVKPPKDPAEARVPTVPAAEETEGARMARELAQAPADRRDQLLETYRDGKGVTYTEALAGAIPQLTGDAAPAGPRRPGRPLDPHEDGDAGPLFPGPGRRDPPRRRPGRGPAGRQNAYSRPHTASERRRAVGGAGGPRRAEGPDRRNAGAVGRRSGRRGSRNSRRNSDRPTSPKREF